MREAVDHGSTGDTTTRTSTDRDTETGIPLENSNVQDGKDAEIGISSEIQGEEIKDVVPNGGYGWVNVGCVVLQNSVTWGTSINQSWLVELANQSGVNTTYGVYSAYYLQNNHFEGGSTFGYAWVGGLCVAVALLIAPGVNFMVRTFGFRVPLIIGTSHLRDWGYTDA
jgi:hypothetical protein